MKENIDNNKMSNRSKMIAALTALSMSVGAGTVNVSAKNDNNSINNQGINIKTTNLDSVIDSLYQKQMSYLVPTISKLKDFYKNEDVKNIIKTAYPEAYSIVNIDLDYNSVSTSYGINYVSKFSDKLESIINNNIYISELKIKSAGNGRDPEYGIIKDDISELGFRTKTEEDKRLINKYDDILGNRVLIDNNIVNLVSSIKKMIIMKKSYLKH